MINDKYKINQFLSKTALGNFYSVSCTDSPMEDELILLEAHAELVAYSNFESTFSRVIKEFSRPESPLNIKETLQADDTQWIVFNEHPSNFFLKRVISKKNTSIKKSQRILNQLLEATKYISPKNGFGFLEPDAIVISNNSYKLLNAPLALTLNILTQWKPNESFKLESKYISPEVARGITPTKQDDVFSLASIACLLFDTNPSSLSLPNSIDSSISDALKRALSPQRYARHNSAHELLHIFTEAVFTRQQPKQYNTSPTKKYAVFSGLVIASLSSYFYFMSNRNVEQVVSLSKQEHILEEKETPQLVSTLSSSDPISINKTKKNSVQNKSNSIETAQGKKDTLYTLALSAIPTLEKIEPHTKKEITTKSKLPIPTIIKSKDEIIKPVFIDLAMIDKKPENTTGHDKTTPHTSTKNNTLEDIVQAINKKIPSKHFTKNTSKESKSTPSIKTSTLNKSQLNGGEKNISKRPKKNTSQYSKRKPTSAGSKKAALVLSKKVVKKKNISPSHKKEIKKTRPVYSKYKAGKKNKTTIKRPSKYITQPITITNKKYNAFKARKAPLVKKVKVYNPVQKTKNTNVHRYPSAVTKRYNKVAPTLRKPTIKRKPKITAIKQQKPPTLRKPTIKRRPKAAITKRQKTIVKKPTIFYIKKQQGVSATKHIQSSPSIAKLAQQNKKKATQTSKFFIIKSTPKTKKKPENIKKKQDNIFFVIKK